MGVSSRVRRLLVESPGSVGGRARAQRWRLVAELFPDLADLRVVDLGGTAESWQRAPVQPKHVTVVNLTEPGEPASWITTVLADACDPYGPIEEATGATSFDLVFSNSLLEHVGGHARRVDVANAVRTLAPRYWVQTPYRYFPMEPHWLFPGMQFLPAAVRARIAASWPLAHSGAGSLEQAMSQVLLTELLSVTEMRSYFPDAQVIHERFLGLTKSLVAAKA
jgi:hypothetical protein